jgi:hypothetical protein
MIVKLVMDIFVGIAIGLWLSMGIIVLGWAAGMIIRGINFILAKLG